MNTTHKAPTRIEYQSKSDSNGRCHFSLHWMADYHPGYEDEYVTAERGQHFYADPTEHGHPRPDGEEAGR